MKKVILSLVFIVMAGFLFAQSPLPKGSKQLNAGFGFSDWGLPVYVGLDFGVHPDISIGAEFTYRSYNESWGGYKYHHSIWSLGGNANYHFNTVLNIPSNWDFYAGINVGFYHWNYDSDVDKSYNKDHTSGLGLGAQIGGRYYFSERFGLNLEFGGGHNTLAGGKFGISLKF